MSWICINCESANDYSHTNCSVCGYERYFSVSEVNELLETQQTAPDEFKKIQTNFKRASTDNKKLRQEKKDLTKKMQDLQHFHDTHAQTTQELEEETVYLRKTNFQLRLALVIGAITLLFFILAKVSINIDL